MNKDDAEEVDKISEGALERAKGRCRCRCSSGCRSQQQHQAEHVQRRAVVQIFPTVEHIFCTVVLERCIKSC